MIKEQEFNEAVERLKTMLLSRKITKLQCLKKFGLSYYYAKRIELGLGLRYHFAVDYKHGERIVNYFNSIA